MEQTTCCYSEDDAGVAKFLWVEENYAAEFTWNKFQNIKYVSMYSSSHSKK